MPSGALEESGRWPVAVPDTSASSCGHEALAWSGQCAGCGEWNTLVERPRRPGGARGRARRARAARAAPQAGRRCATSSARESHRLETGIGELDRVLGGGLVPGSLVLLGGSPGIGKSTLTGMALGNLAGGRAPTPLRLRRGVGGAGAAARRAARRRRRSTSRCSPRPRSRRCWRRSRPSARGLRDRLDPDAARRGADRRARARSARSARPPRAIMEVAKRLGLRGDPGRPRDQGGRARRARGCSSTWSTACSSSRASASAPTARCGRSRTASARPARSASSRCAPAA